MSGKRGWERRDVLRTSGVAIVGTATAGCLGSDGDGGNGEHDDDNGENDDGDTGSNVTDANTTGSNETAEIDDTDEDVGTDEIDDTDETDDTDDTDDTDEDDEEPSDDGSYTVSMPPVGEVEFESVPQTWAANNGSWADMGIALGQEPPEALYLTRRYHTEYYDVIPDVSVDPDGIDSLWDYELAVEEFLQLAGEVDAFVMDPEFFQNRADWAPDRIERVESTGTPFFGNSVFSRSYGWHDYEYLTLYEAFEKLAAVFQEQERYEAFASLHDEFQSELETVVPAGDRPEVAVLWPLGNDAFLTYRINGGTSFKHLRDLEVEDALANVDPRNVPSQIGYETLLEIDPEHVLLRSDRYLSEAAFRRRFVEPMGNHNVGRELTAVRNDDVYRAGPLYQGPIVNLVATQRMAGRLYGVEAELFDPQEVSDIVNGTF